MPHLYLALSHPTPQALDLPLLAQELTALVALELSKQHELTALRVSLHPAQDWFIGAQALQQEASYHLVVQITAGTNSEAQNAQFIEAAHHLLCRCLGAVATASYVVLQDLDAASWGYSGHTQAARHHASTLRASRLKSM